MASTGQSPANVLAQTDRILGSPRFSKSPALAKFLRFVVELTLNGKEDELKEYRLGVDVFGRGDDFDPRLDPIVRMQAAKLRARLAEYYGEEGRGDPVVISIPKGGYVPTFARGADTAPASPRHTAKNGDLQSIAVLPFVNMSSDPDNEYFSDGLTEELINLLASVPGLRVVARTSAFSFKNTNKDVRDIGAQLNVRIVLEGSVRKAGDQLRVTAQLIDVSSGYHLFSKTYPRALRDVFALQEELSSAVVTEIMPQVKADTPSPRVQTSTANLEVYNLYLKAAYILANKFSGPTESAEIFRQVLDRDPHYAPAWAGLAQAYFFMAWYGLMLPKEAMQLGKAAALRALDLDGNLAAGHATFGMLQATFDWDWLGSEGSFQRAIRAQPSLSIAHQFYGFVCLLPQRRWNEAVDSLERALALNPFDLVLGVTATIAYGCTGNFAAAQRQHDLIREVNPNQPLIYGAIAMSQYKQGRLQESLAAFRRAYELSGGVPFPLAGVANVLGKLGERGEAEKVLQQLQNAKNRSGFCLCLAYLGLGRREEALRSLEHSMEEREPQLLLASFDPRFDELQEDPDFRNLLDRMGLRLVA